MMIIKSSSNTADAIAIVNTKLSLTHWIRLPTPTTGVGTAVGEAAGKGVDTGATGAVVALTAVGAAVAGWPSIKVNLLELVPRGAVTCTESRCGWPSTCGMRDKYVNTYCSFSWASTFCKSCVN